MNLQYDTSHAGAFLILLIAFAFALAYLIYFFKKNKEEFSVIQRYLLGSIKFISSLLIVILLLSPLFETIKNRIEKPILILGIDNSESLKSDTSNVLFLENMLSDLKVNLGSQFQIETLLFGEKLIPSEKADFDDQKSNYSNFFSEIDKRYFNLNVGAVLLIGDGIYNEGRNPGQHTSRIKAPVFTVGIGDTLARLDQAIVDVTHNPNVFLNNSFPVEVEVSFSEFTPKNTQISIYIDGKLEQSESIAVIQANYYFQKTYDLKATETGLKNVEIVLSPVINELNTRNNRNRFTIEVHDNKKKILVLSQGPHPDIGALTQTLENKANFNISAQNISLFNGKFDDFDLVVLNQLPSLRSQHLPVFSTLKNHDIPVMVIVGPSTSVAALNNLDLDITLKPTLINQESAPYFNSAFSLFSLPLSINEIEKVYPPLLTLFTEYEYSSQYSVIAYQKINEIEMNYPLILAGEIDGRKTGVVMGEGIWRWRFHEFQNYNNQDAFNQLVVNLFNYLSIKEERDQFRIQYERICSETSAIKLKAQVFNDIYEPVNNAEVKLILSDSTGKQLSYVFDANQSEYNLNLGFLSPGNYQFEAQTILGENEFVKSGVFSVQEVNIEQQNLQSNFKVLNFISHKTGGQFFLKENSSELIEQLKNNKQIQSKTHKEKSIYELIDWKWFILFIILLISLEWFLRKFWGSY